MKISIYTWDPWKFHGSRDPWNQISENWKSDSKKIVDNNKSVNQITFNHYLKEYRKNFKCTKHQLAKIIKKAKIMNECDFISITI